MIFRESLVYTPLMITEDNVVIWNNMNNVFVKFILQITHQSSTLHTQYAYFILLF